MPRTKGALNKTHKPATKTVAVRLSPDELAKLRRVHRSPSKAIKQLIAAATATG